MITLLTWKGFGHATINIYGTVTRREIEIHKKITRKMGKYKLLVTITWGTLFKHKGLLLYMYIH